MKRAIFILLISLPLALFFAVREMASWRPHKVADLPYHSALAVYHGLAISLDERFVANASSDEQGLITVRDLQSGREVKRLALRRRVSCLVFSLDGRQIAIAWSKSTAHYMANETKRIGVSLWDFKGQFRHFEMVKDDLVFDSPTQLRFSPDGKTLWMASTDNLRAWAVASGKLKWRWRKEEMGRDSSLPFYSAISKNCRLYFHSGSSGYTVWDMKANKQKLVTELPFLNDSDLHFSFDTSLATYHAETPNGVFNPVVKADTGQLLWQSPGEPELTIVSDKAVRRKGNTFEVRNARNGKLLSTLPAALRSSPLPLESRLWLYTINDKRELFRQRLQ